jgi:hypothetical protein
MNIEKLYKVSAIVVKDIADNKVKEMFNGFVSALAQIVQQPQQPQYQTNFATAKDNFFQALNSCQFNDFGAIDLQIIGELGGTDILGNNLARKIENVLASVNTTMLPAQAQQQIQPIQQEFDKFVERLTKMNKLFDDLGIEKETLLEDNQSEISIVFPRDIVDGDFGNFEKDVKSFRRFLECIREIAGAKEDYKISKISSSDFLIALVGTLGFASLLAKAINPILDMFIKIQEIRINREKLKQMKAPQKVIKETEDWEKGIVKETIDATTKIMLEKVKADKIGRQQAELDNYVKTELEILVQKLDNGYQVVVSMNEETEPEEGENGEAKPKENKEAIELLEQLKTLNANSEKVYSVIQTDGRILQLPAYGKEAEEATGKKGNGNE